MTARRKLRWLRTRSQGGFTLIEVLVALSLLALAVSLLPGALRLASQAWASRGDAERVESLAMALDALEKRISQSMPIFERDSRGGVRLLFEGDGRTLRFVGPADTGPSGPGVFRTGLAPAPEGGGLVMSLSNHGVSRPGEQARVVSHIVAAPGTAVRFRYFGAIKRGAAPQWHDAWQRPDNLPMLVEVTAEMRTDRARHVQRRVIVPRLNVRS